MIVTYRLRPRVQISPRGIQRWRTWRALWRATSPLDLADIWGAVREDRDAWESLVRRLVFLSTRLFSVVKDGSFGEEVRDGAGQRLVTAPYSLFGDGFGDIVLHGWGYGAGLETPFKTLLHHESRPGVHTQALMATVGHIARVRRLARAGRTRSRLLSWLFLHRTTRSLAFLDRLEDVNAVLPMGTYIKLVHDVIRLVVVVSHIYPDGPLWVVAEPHFRELYEGEIAEAFAALRGADARGQVQFTDMSVNPPQDAVIVYVGTLSEPGWRGLRRRVGGLAHFQI